MRVHVQKHHSVSSKEPETVLDTESIDVTWISKEPEIISNTVSE